MPRSLKAHLLLVIVTFIWGSTFVLVKAALRDSSPLMLNAARMILAAVLLGLYYRKHLSGMRRPAMVMGSSIGVFLFLGYAFQTTGLRLTTPSKSAFLTGGSTVLVPLVMLGLWRTRIPIWRAVGIALAFVGLFLMTVPAGEQGLADFAKINAGDVLTIACALAFAFQIVVLGRGSRRFPFEQMAVLQVAVAAVLTAMAAPVLEHPQFKLSETVVLATLITGVLGTAVAFTVQAWAQQFTPPTHAALIFTLEPVFAWLTSFVYSGERLGLRAGFGAFLILTGILLSELLGSVSRGEEEVAEAREQASPAG
ncbi:MAG TPA: DMT family transporter [Candidatus Acidoferrales bacterium]|nr:DMT family transporter [Candidatus Acidoferrales bacterium]